jgi:hypothetical protein
MGICGGNRADPCLLKSLQRNPIRRMLSSRSSAEPQPFGEREASGAPLQLLHTDLSPLKFLGNEPGQRRLSRRRKAGKPYREAPPRITHSLFPIALSSDNSDADPS